MSFFQDFATNFSGRQGGGRGRGSQSMRGRLSQFQNRGQMGQPQTQAQAINAQQPGFFSGSPAQSVTSSRFSPQQQQIMNQLATSALSQLPNLDQGIMGMGQNRTAAFDPIEQRARTQFQENTIPSLAGKFTAMGEGGRRSGEFQRQLGEAGAGLESDLAAQRAQFGQQERQLGLQELGTRGNLLQALLQMGLGQQYDTSVSPAQMSTLSKMLPALAEGAGKGLGMVGGALF